MDRPILAPFGSVITSTGARRSARIARINNIHLQNIFCCADIWLDIFAFIGPGQLGLKLALLSNRFDCLVDKHFKTRKWALGKFEIRMRKEDKIVQIVKRVKNGRMQWLPMPQQPLPNGLVGFNEIIVRYVDQAVIEFLGQILRHVGANITLQPKIYSYFYSSWNIFTHQIWPMLKPNISRMMFDGKSNFVVNGDNFSQLRCHLSPAVLRDCANLRVVQMVAHPPGGWPSEGNGRMQWLPMPQHPLPNGLVGFNKIIVRYVDQAVIEFLDQILRHVGANITLLPKIYSCANASWHIFTHQLWPMLKPNISRMMFDGKSPFMGHGEYFTQLRLHLSPAVLRECANLRSIDSVYLYPAGGAADDSLGTSNGKALSKWLHTPRGDGRPKVLKFNAWHSLYHVTKTFKELKKAFVNASSSVSYVVRVDVVRVDAYLEHMEPFVVENRATRECLTLHRARRGDAWIMERGPIGRDEQQWAVWTREAMEKKNWPNLLHFEFGDRDIG
uniref:F-box domain-containing protein n=1 Tax=Globodera pallida TaxID=36090 RepID=A0A183C0A4_GLOPA